MTKMLEVKNERIIPFHQFSDFGYGKFTLGTDDQGVSRVAMDKNGNFVVVWHDNRDGDYNIYAHRFDSTTFGICPEVSAASAT